MHRTEQNGPDSARSSANEHLHLLKLSKVPRYAPKNLVARTTPRNPRNPNVGTFLPVVFGTLHRARRTT